MTTPPPGDRLERALQAWLAATPTTHAEGDALLAANPELAELLAPMVQGTPPGEAPADERVLGDFRLVRELGRGGMGIVYEAWQRSLDRRVAVKVLVPAMVANPAAVARFRREATSAGRLQHANIVEVFGFGSDGDEHFFAMQFIDGAPLQEVSGRFRTPAAAIGLARQLVDALAHAHEAGIVHRDVKPANVLVRADGVALLTDFGVARDDALPSLTREGGFLGTLDYASPEQVRGEVVDARTDLWAVGVILHELLAGEHPFTTPTQQGTMHSILMREPRSLRGRTGVSDDLAAVVDHALAKERHRRYATATAMLADLSALERGDPVSVRLPGRTERLRRWAAREPWRAVAAVALLLGVPMLAGTVGYLVANAGRIEVATRAEVRQAREELLSSASVSLVDSNVAAGLATLATIEAGDEEAAVLRALLHMRRDDADAARHALHGQTGAIAALVRQVLDHPLPVGAEPDLAKVEAFECFVRAHVLFAAANHRGNRSRPLLQQALALARTATMLAPAPRLNYLTTLASVADLVDDRATLRSAAHALELHFPDSESGTFVRARSWSRHDPAMALQLLDRLDASIGVTARGQACRGLALEYQGQFERAIAANRTAVALEDGNYIAWHNLGTSLRKHKRLADAEAALRNCIERNPLYAPAWNTLGLVLRDRGDDAGAQEAFTRALDANADYAAAARNLGNLLLRLGKTEPAVEAFRRAVAAEPEEVRNLANLGDALARTGRNQEALQWSLRAAALAPDTLIANFNTAELALRLRLPALAVTFAARARDAGKNDANGLGIWAKALLAQDQVDWPAALAAAQAADQAHRGNDVDTRIMVARALAGSGEQQQAIAALRAAMAEPRFATAAPQQKLQAALAATEGR